MPPRFAANEPIIRPFKPAIVRGRFLANGSLHHAQNAVAQVSNTSTPRKIDTDQSRKTNPVSGTRFTTERATN